MRPTALILTAVLAAACSSGGSETPPPTSGTPATAGKCSEVVKSNAAVTDVLIDQGCVDDNGTKRMGTVKQCKDGRRLWEMNGMIGRSGGEMVPTDLEVNGTRSDRLLELICSTQKAQTASTPPAPTAGS